MTTPTVEAGHSAHAIQFIAERLRICLRLIESTPDKEADQKALLWMLIEEMIGLLSRAWRFAR